MASRDRRRALLGDKYQQLADEFASELRLVYELNA
jgi:hypothetical protein